MRLILWLQRVKSVLQFINQVFSLLHFQGIYFDPDSVQTLIDTINPGFNLCRSITLPETKGHKSYDN